MAHLLTLAHPKKRKEKKSNVQANIVRLCVAIVSVLIKASIFHIIQCAEEDDSIMLKFFVSC